MNHSEENYFENNNKIIGNPVLKSSKINFKGENNIIICEENVTLQNSQINFNGDNSVVWLSSNRHTYIVDISINHNSACYYGKNNYFNGCMHVIISEETNVFFGNDGLFSFDIWVRTADPHLIFDCNTHQRINYSKSIYIGDHIWLGQDIMLLKGTEISSGSIVSAKACVSGKRIPSNVIVGGVPAKQLKKDIFWRKDCVHGWTKQMTEKNSSDSSNTWIYKYSEEEYLPFEKLENLLNSSKNSEERLQVLRKASENGGKNRFAFSEDMVKDFSPKRKSIFPFSRH